MFSKVEKLIMEVKGLPSGSMDLAAKSYFLERVAGEVSKLDLLMAQGKARHAKDVLKRLILCGSILPYKL